MYKCENCGGDLVFDPKSQGMKCSSCNTLFPIDITRDNGIEIAEDGSMEADVFVCPNCGGQLIGATESIVDFCPYCGTEVQTKTEKVKQLMPQAIVPFSVTKDQCKQIYKKGVGKFIFAPSEMKSEKFIDRVQGVYVPYWSYFCDVNGPVNCECVDSHRSGDYIIKRYYDVSCDVKGKTVVSYDASRELDDDLSKGAGGFTDESIKKFTPQFLSGYYADLPDISEKEHLYEAGNEVRQAALSKATADTHMAIERTNDSNLNVNVRPARTAMPMYFLTWRGQGKVAYSLVNGQNGKLSARLPIDFMKYFITSLIVAIPLFLIFFFMPATIMPETVAVISGLILAIAMLIEVLTGRKALSKEKEVFGIDVMDRQLKKPIHMPKGGTIAVIFVVLYVFFGIFGQLAEGSTGLAILKIIDLILGIIFFVMALVNSGRAIKLSHEHHEGWFSNIARGLALAGFPAFVGIILSGGLTFIDLVRDEFYYAIAIYSMFISILIFINCISEFNYSVTRPLKYFERRKGLKDHV